MSDTITGPASSVPLDFSTKVLMVSGGALVGLAQVAVAVVLPQIEKALAHSDQDKLLVKLLVTVIGFTMVAGAPIAGFLVDRIGMRLILMVCCTAYAIAGTAGLYVDSLDALLASRLVLGLAAAGTATMSMTLINTRLAGNQRAKFMGLHIAVALIAAMIASPVAGNLGEFGWRWPFALYALSLPLAVLAAVHLKNPSPRVAAAPVRKTWEMFPRWFPYRYVVLAFVMGCMNALTTVYYPYVMRDAGVPSPKYISYVILADSAMAIVTSMLFGRFQRYISPHAALAMAFGLASLGMFVAALTSNIYIIIAGMLIFGLGLGWHVAGLMIAAARHVSPERQGRATGIIKGAFYLAAPSSTILIEPVTRAYGSHGALWTVSLLSFGCLVLFASRIISHRASFGVMPAVAAGVQDSA